MTNQEAHQSDPAQSAASESVRKAFAALPFGERISTLFKVELDLVGEVAETIVNEASRALDEIADAVVGRRPSQAGPSTSADQSAQSAQ
jgi:hypothetical protein